MSKIKYGNRRQLPLDITIYLKTLENLSNSIYSWYFSFLSYLLERICFWFKTGCDKTVYLERKPSIV